MASVHEFPVDDLHRKLQHQLIEIRRLEDQLSTLQSSNQNNLRNDIRQYLLGIRSKIEDLRDRETELQNNNLILRNKVHYLHQEISDLTIQRLKLSKRKHQPARPMKTTSTVHSPSNIHSITTVPKAMAFSPTNSGAVHPGLYAKRPSPPSSMMNEMFQPTPSTLTHRRWKFESLKSPMANSKELDSISTELGIKTLPEMVFAKSYLRLTFPVQS